MLLANLLLELRTLLADPEANFDRIVERLAAHQDFAEYEVARHYVSTKLEPSIWRRLEQADPRERRAAIDAVGTCFSRARAGQVLRRLYKDPDWGVRQRARGHTAALGIDDRALAGGWGFGTGGSVPTLAPAAIRADLPTFASADALARWLGHGGAEDLRRFMRSGSGRGAAYVDFEVPKASGGMRRISAPRAPLRAIQRKILADILGRVPTHDAAHGFVAGRSTLTNAEPHVGARLVIKTDIRDFFPTIHHWRVRGLFVQLGYGDLAGTLASLCTRRERLEPDDPATAVTPGRLPQGAPTSPAIANLVCRRLDARLAGLADKLGARYTRYADDLTFSLHGPDADEVALGRLFWWIDQILQQEGFAENAGKRQVLRPHRRQLVTGIVVNQRPTIPRADRRRFRAILHNCRTGGLASQANGRDDFADYLRGYAAYVHMVQPDLGRRWQAEVEAILTADAG